jgi:hypothetical protein
MNLEKLGFLALIVGLLCVFEAASIELDDQDVSTTSLSPKYPRISSQIGFTKNFSISIKDTEEINLKFEVETNDTVRTFKT